METHGLAGSKALPSALEMRVMRRVRRARAVGAVVNGKTLALLVAAAALWGIGREVWVARVFQNAPSAADLSASLRFWTAAFLDTRAVVQLLILVMLAATLYLAREAARILSSRTTIAFSY